MFPRTAVLLSVVVLAAPADPVAHPPDLSWADPPVPASRLGARLAAGPARELPGRVSGGIGRGTLARVLFRDDFEEGLSG